MKIAILLDSLILPHWKHKIIKDLCNNESVKLDIIKIRYSLPDKIFNFIKRLNFSLFYLYEKLDYLVFSRTNKFKEIKFEKDALKRFPLKKSKYNVDIIEFVLGKKSFLLSKNQHFDKNTPFDVIIDLTRPLEKHFYKDLSKYSKKGICFFEIGDNQYLYPPFFNEIYSNKPTANIYLNISDGKYKAGVYKSSSSLYNFSLYLNNNKNLWKISDFINRTIDKINNNNFFDPDSNKEYFHYNHKMPSNFMMFKFITIVLKNIIKQKLTNRKSHTQWFLAYKKASKEPEFVSENELNFNIIAPPPDRFFADPFIISENNKSYVFFEDYYYSKNKGLISYFSISEKGEVSDPKVILEKNCHLSYPFIFKYEDKHYMIPETLGNRTIELYEAEKFPDKWKLRKILINKINAVDTSLFVHNEKFWLFTNVSKSGGGLSDELCIFYSDSLFGEWTPHPKNPVISDVKTARCAGKLFFYKGKLIRPSQETSVRYGYALNFNSVDVLTENDYKETLIKTVNPEFINNNLAIHTFNSDGNYKIIDGMKLVKK